MQITDTHLEVLKKLRQGKTVEAHDKERQQRVYFQAETQEFKYEVEEWGHAEETEVLKTPEAVFKAIGTVRGWAHRNQEEMWESILSNMS